jgi:L-lactate utilization protein LutC
MEKPIDNFWTLRLETVKDALEENNFSVIRVDNLEGAKKAILEQILPEVKPRSLSFGGSMTVVAAGIYAALRDRTDFTVIDTLDKTVSPVEMIERRRRALLVDLFITGSNAVTETGRLVNLDMIGNRTGALSFGPRHVVVCIGRNKIVPDLDEAVFRIKDYAAPANAMRLDKKTPCVKTGICHDCKSPDRICNTWTITEKSFPKGRIKVVLINQDAGL